MQKYREQRRKKLYTFVMYRQWDIDHPFAHWQWLHWLAYKVMHSFYDNIMIWILYIVMSYSAHMFPGSQVGEKRVLPLDHLLWQYWQLCLIF